jgi:TPR repeat protein
MSLQHPMWNEPTDDEPHGNPGQAGRRVRRFGVPMYRWVVMAGLLLAMGAALPARADELADCGSAGTLMKTDPDRAVSACRHLADQGDAGAQYNLGVAYANGQGVAQNYAEAIKWFRKAADQGDAHAQYGLGVAYAKGHGIPRDFVQAHVWFNLAAAQGDAEAAKGRDLMASIMTPSQIEKAQALVAAWKPTTAQ